MVAPHEDFDAPEILWSLRDTDDFANTLNAMRKLLRKIIAATRSLAPRHSTNLVPAMILGTTGPPARPFFLARLPNLNTVTDNSGKDGPIRGLSFPHAPFFGRIPAGGR